MAWDEIKHGLNSTLGTSDFTSLDKRKSLMTRFINKAIEQITLASIPTTVGDSTGGVRYNDEMFVFYDTTLQIYNIKTNVWRNGATIPATIGLQCFPLLIDGEIYVFGNTNAQKYNISTNTWIVLATIPRNVNTYGHKPIFVNGEIYVCTSYNTSFLKYNIASNSWTILANLPITNIRNQRFVELNGFIYAMWSTSVYKYDISANRWTTIASPVSTSGSNIEYLFAYNNEIYNFGAIAKKFNPTTNITTALANPSKTCENSKPLIDEINKKVYFVTTTAIYIYSFKGNVLSEFGGLFNCGTHIAEFENSTLLSARDTDIKSFNLDTAPIILFLNKGNKVYLDGELIETIEEDGKYSYSVETDVSNIGGFSTSILQIT